MKNSQRQQPFNSTELKSKIALKYGFLGAALAGLSLAAMTLFVAPKKEDQSTKKMQVIAGRIYGDINENGLMDPGEFPRDSVKIKIFIDNDSDGLVSVGDTPVDSVYTDSDGMYEWKTFSSNTLVVEID